MLPPAEKVGCDASVQVCAKRPRDPAELADLVGRMATGEIPNDKDEILNPPEPTGKAKGAQARASALTPGVGPGRRGSQVAV